MKIKICQLYLGENSNKLFCLLLKFFVEFQYIMLDTFYFHQFLYVNNLFICSIYTSRRLQGHPVADTLKIKSTEDLTKHNFWLTDYRKALKNNHISIFFRVSVISGKVRR